MIKAGIFDVGGVLIRENLFPSNPNDMSSFRMSKREFEKRFLQKNVIKIIEQLKKNDYKLAVLSNTQKLHVTFLARNGIYKNFEVKVFSNEVNIRKPDPAIYKLVLNKLKVAPDEAFFVDNRDPNIATARALGIHGILFESANSLKKQLKTLGVNTQQIPAPHHHQELLDTLSKSFKKHFGKRVLNFVLFGSSLREPDCGDIDLHLLLDRKKSNDLVIINHILTPLKERLDFLLSYKDEINEADYFRIRHQGKYFLYSLAHGKILIGSKNQYLEAFNRLSADSIKSDLHLKNAEYQSTLREILMNPSVLTQQSTLAKYLVRYLSQTLVIQGKLSYKEILSLNKVNLFKKVCSLGILSKSEVAALRKIHCCREKDKDKLIRAASKILFKIDFANEACLAKR